MTRTSFDMAKEFSITVWTINQKKGCQQFRLEKKLIKNLSHRKHWNLYTLYLCISWNWWHFFFCSLCHIVQHIKLVKAWSIFMYAWIFIPIIFFLPSNFTMTFTLFLLLFLDNWWCVTTRCTTRSGTTWSPTWSTPSRGSDSPPVCVHSTRYCYLTFNCNDIYFAVD